MAFRSTNAAALINNRIDKRLVSTLEDNFVLARFAETRPLNKHDGDTVQLTFWNNPAISTGQADELAGGNENAMTFTNVNVSVGFYADDFAFSELGEAIDKTGSVLSGHVGRTIFQVAGTIDTITRDALSAVTATSTRVVNGHVIGSTLAATDTFNIAEVNHVFTVLDGRNVVPHPMSPSCYAGIFHTRPCGDMRGDTGGANGFNDMTWNDWMRRTDASALASGDIKKIIGVDPYKSTNIQRLTDGNSVTYYNNFILGKESLVTTSINGLAAPGEKGGRPLVRVIPKMFSHATPYANKIRVVFKFYYGATIIDETRMMMLQTASAS